MSAWPASGGGRPNRLPSRCVNGSNRWPLFRLFRMFRFRRHSTTERPIRGNRCCPSLTPLVERGLPERVWRPSFFSADDEQDVSVGIRLLGEIRDAFDDKATDHLSTHDLLAFLHELEEAPWGDWYGKPLTPRALARLLDPYDVVPVRQRVGGVNRRGYFRSDFTDAWTRYVPVGESVPDVDGSLGLFAPSTKETLRDGGQEPSEVPVGGIGTSGTSGTVGEEA